MSGVWGFSAWMSLSRVGASAKSPAAAIERRENVVPAGLVRPAKSNGPSATHRAKVKRQRWLSPRRNAMDSSCRSKEMSTNVAPLARNNSLASSTALLFPQSLNVMLPLEIGQRFGPNSGWTLAIRKPDRPIARSSPSIGAFKLQTSKTRPFGFSTVMERKISAEADIGTETDDLPIDLRDLVSQPCDFRLAQRKLPTSMRSRIAIAAAFSTTGTARGTIHGS